MKGGESRTLVIRVRARLQQRDRQLEMAVLDGQEERAHPPGRGLPPQLLDLHHLVHVGARLEQDPNHLGAAFSDGEEQWRESRSEWRAKVGSRLEQRLHDGRMTVGRRPHQRRLSPPLPGIHLRAPGEQRPDRPQLPGARGRHERRLVAG